MKKTLVSFLATLIAISTFAQHELQKYVPESDPLVLEKLEQWQDLKFGLLMHWGAYSQWNIVESWSICPEDYGWCERKKEATPTTYNEYVKAYENLQTTFNPTKFNPNKWAKAARNAGMKYVVFTTKHHDGFSMFDSKYTDYKVTDAKTPFSTNKRANIAKEVFDAFRSEGLWAGAYFSKPDWHSKDYWWDYFPAKDRNVNYDPAIYPERWQRFTEFVHNQILELLTDYGKIDIIWLDGGWVAKQSKEKLNKLYANELKNSETGFIKGSIVSQDIKMDELVKKARKKQPGLIVVDRAVKGKNQNYLTPENTVPKKELPYPWESCIISGGGWSHSSNAKYMSGHKAVSMLLDIVCKGGNLLLNVAPSADGTWDTGAYKLLEEIGQWMAINSEAIYNTRAITPYKESKICYTNKKGTNTVYANYITDISEKVIPKYIPINAFQTTKESKITLLGSDEPLNWETNGTGIVIKVPEKLRNNPPCKYAWSFKITEIKTAK